ncbi:MAG: hypothetical protein SF051_11820 [Elusimicrobiota bacterium]|nr:hypothetical protein [Elusimicrobiota bacterium]
MARDAVTVRLDARPGLPAKTLWALVAAGALAAFFVAPAREPWDLKLCLACAETLAAGEDPYGREQIVGGVSFPCLYPPLAFDLYRPFAAMGDPVPWWNALKVLGFAALLLLWRRVLPPGRDGWRLAFALGAFGTPFFAEYRSGNAGSLEQLALWGTFALFIAGRYAAFAVALAAVAQLKLQPALFLGLLLLAPKPRWKEFALGAAVFAGLFGLNELLHPGLLGGYLSRLGDPSAAWRYERGPNNCSAWAFLQHLLETAAGSRPLASRWASLLVVPWSCFVAAVTALSARRVATGPGTDEEKRRFVVLLGTAAFALLAPRFKDYAFFLVIPAALVALESAAPLLWRAPLLVFAALNSTKAAAERMGLGPWALVAGYFKLYAAVLVWAVLVSLNNPWHSRREKR